MGKHKKSFLHTRRDSGTAETIESPPPAPEVCDEPEIYDFRFPTQVEKSPYTTRAITLIIGRSEPGISNQYTIPEHFLEPYPQLRVDEWSNSLMLQNINPDIGHTLVHYLCTGRYQTVKPSPPVTGRRLIEFRRAVHVYATARIYEIPGLESLAQKYIQLFSDDVTLLDVLVVSREVFATLPEDESWLSEYIIHRMSATLEADEKAFHDDLHAYGIGRDELFDPLILKVVLALYQARTTARNSAEDDVDPSHASVNGIDSPAVHVCGPSDIESQDAPLDEHSGYPPEEIAAEPDPEPVPSESPPVEEAVYDEPPPEEPLPGEPEEPEEPPVEAPPAIDPWEAWGVTHKVSDLDIPMTLSSKAKGKQKKKKVVKK